MMKPGSSCPRNTRGNGLSVYSLPFQGPDGAQWQEYRRDFWHERVLFQWGPKHYSSGISDPRYAARHFLPERWEGWTLERIQLHEAEHIFLVAYRQPIAPHPIALYKILRKRWVNWRKKREEAHRKRQSDKTTFKDIERWI